jgi:hypothetical protein
MILYCIVVESYWTIQRYAMFSLIVPVHFHAHVRTVANRSRIHIWIPQTAV